MKWVFNLREASNKDEGTMDKSKWKDLLGWKVAALVLLGLVWFKSPAQLPVLMYKTFIVCFAVVLAHWVDESFFGQKITRHEQLNEIARALVFFAVVLGFSLGL